MNESAAEALTYLQDNVLLALFIAFVVGFLATKTVAQSGKSNFLLYLVVGALGSFVGQFGVRYIGLQSILEQVAGMALIFDVLIAYFGSFIVAALVHMFKPM
jgi:uncharacterized membrane protein YeaQ/YmgE (transglycosylase-associated protein family)